MIDNTKLIDTIEKVAANLRDLVVELHEGMDENADESNEGNLQDAMRSLDDFDGAIGDVIP